MTAAPAPRFALVRAQPGDFEALHALRLRALRTSLERLADGFVAAQTQHIVVDGQRVGFIVLRRLSHAWRLKHFYIDPPHTGQGLGSEVLRWICAGADREQQPLELVALKGSDAHRFYLRHGFVVVGDGPWDLDYVRRPASPGVASVRALWAAVQARDWAALRALLRDDLQAVWWTSGERFDGAESFVAVQRRYPEGWAVRLIEAVRLDDGRVLSVVRVDHPPQRYFATSVFRIDDGLVAAIDEYWATAEPPPAWRGEASIAGLGRFSVDDDARARAP